MFIFAIALSYASTVCVTKQVDSNLMKIAVQSHLSRPNQGDRIAYAQTTV